MGCFTFKPNASKANVDSSPETYETSSKPVETTPKLVETHLPDAAPSSSHTESVEETKPTPTTAEPESRPAKAAKRISFQSLAFTRKHHAEHKPVLTAAEEHHKRDHAAVAAEVRAVKQKVSRSDKSAKKTALAVRALIVGPSAAAPQVTPTVVKPQLNKIKSQLMQPKSANKLIAQLRQLPARGGDPPTPGYNGPIHAVCLTHTDEEEEELHFAKLAHKPETTEETTEAFALPGVGSAPIDQLTDLLKDMNVIDLIKSRDFGLGQPGSGSGILAGAVPTAETVINGVKRITPELMALGFAAGRSLAPDHTGIYPPTDRMSVLTYWWGLEVLLPPPSIAFLSNVNSVTGSVMNFLTAISLVNNGVREILPFIRYISQFIDFEFSSIKKADKGDGVVCAATWIMPAAMVPRAWDFPVPPTLEAPVMPAPSKGSENPEGFEGRPVRGPGILLPPSELPSTQISSPLDLVVATSPSPPPTAPSPATPTTTAPVLASV